MYRLIIVLALLVVVYFLLRNLIRELTGRSRRDETLPDKNQMVQDPVCRTYVPRGTAVAATIGGQTYYFCSQDCARTLRNQLAS
ncbi:YHS domain-containing protein [Nitrospira sp. Kam-Ns4a]